jgi:hypothetical protein
MTARVSHTAGTVVGKRRRRLLGLEPIFEGGWLHKGKRAHRWDVEDELLAVALFGDVTIDLSETKSAPADIVINAWAILRDVDVTVAEGTHVELSGGGFRGHLVNEVPDVPEEDRDRVVRIHGHTLVCDVTVRVAEGRA